MFGPFGRGAIFSGNQPPSDIVYDTSTVDQRGGFAPDLTMVAPGDTQRDVPGTNPQSIITIPNNGMPDPTVGGSTQAKFWQGVYGGFVSFQQKVLPFGGHMSNVPNTKYQVPIGNVGLDGHADQLFAGVKNQLTSFVPSQAQIAQAYVGTVNESTIYVGEGGEA